MEDKELARIGATVLRKLVKYTGPVGAGIDDAIGVIAGAVGNRMRERQTERTATFLRGLAAKVELLEGRDATDEEVDVFEEILAAAARQEDKHKVPCYVNLVDLYLREKLAPPLVRILGQALKTLSLAELWSFADFAAGRCDLGKGIPDILNKAFMLRIDSLGLMSTSGAHTISSVTPLGQKLVALVPEPPSN